MTSWWQCSQCGGWFAGPLPPPDVIRSNWRTVLYADPSYEQIIASYKSCLTNRILTGLRERGSIGTLLDVGCSTGKFMLEALGNGWKVAGFDPNEAATAMARQRGLDVRTGWTVQECGYDPATFDAITAVDVFYYSQHPLEDLRTFQRLLRDGGTLAMRISNKRFIMGLARYLVSSSDRRDVRLSRLLQGQFHSISLGSLASVLKEIGFSRIHYEPAPTAPLRCHSIPSRMLYLIANALHRTTLGRIHLSPGILLFAQKAPLK